MLNHPLPQVVPARYVNSNSELDGCHRWYWQTATEDRIEKNDQLLPATIPTNTVCAAS